ncbi:PE-PPE domain-containing protein [Mycobacterium sp. 852014-52144_SCH5372336]|uniref:PE-PPE domain-containing protein n=1 Tax=Mycobacterium sp. 852014-52144_SCH5372336 TaxID=1834115 RepID=UPI001E5C2FE2|nr:PE-PPE domain-containing protein [Mycobacterium sp. 852014-52144_SCH5372336]
MENFRDYYMQGTACGNNGCADDDLEGVDYFASFWPIPLPGWCDPGRCEKFDDSVDDGVQSLKEALQALQELDPAYDGALVIAGYSQGARVVSIAKTNIANGDWADLIDGLESVEFVFIGNPNRPNGGILSRLGILRHIPILDVTTGQPTPTGPLPGFLTEDWAIRWEGIADFPQYLFNPLAIANSLLGFYYDHGTYLAKNGGSDPGELPAGYDIETWEKITSNPKAYPGIVEIQEYGDTTYYTVTPKVLPLVRPLHAIPFVGKPIADLIEPALRVIIEETGYNRNIPYGQYSPIGLIPFFNPITLFLKLVPAIFTGINNFLANFGLAKEIPLSPTTPVPVTDDEQEDDVDLTALAGSEPEESSGARLAMVHRYGDVDQEITGVYQKNGLIAEIRVDDDLTLAPGVETSGIDGSATPVVDGIEMPVVDGNETADIDGVTETEKLPGAVLETTPIGNPEVVGEKTTGGNAVIAVKEPEVNQDPDVKKDSEVRTNPAQNRIDANGRSVSLDASPNKPAAGPADAGNGSVQKITPASPAPSEGLTTKPDPGGTTKDPQGANDAQDSKDSEPAAA